MWTLWPCQEPPGLTTWTGLYRLGSGDAISPRMQTGAFIDSWPGLVFHSLLAWDRHPSGQVSQPPGVARRDIRCAQSSHPCVGSDGTNCHDSEPRGCLYYGKGDVPPNSQRVVRWSWEALHSAAGLTPTPWSNVTIFLSSRICRQHVGRSLTRIWQDPRWGRTIVHTGPSELEGPSNLTLPLVKLGCLSRPTGCHASSTTQSHRLTSGDGSQCAAHPGTSAHAPRALQAHRPASQARKQRWGLSLKCLPLWMVPKALSVELGPHFGSWWID